MTAAIAWFVFGAITVALSLQYPIGSLWAPGSGLYPLVLGLMLMGLAAAHAVRVGLEQPKPAVTPGAPSWRLDDATRRVLLFMGVVALCTALLQAIGYVASGLLLMLGLLRVFAVRWGAAALIAAFSAAAAHVLFVRWLDIPMPAGPLGF
jgi:putative tricarboxylic transport membrane protein